MASLYDSIPPSERVEELRLVMRKLRRELTETTVPVLVVEGPSDEHALARICSAGAPQVFAAGTRGLVEQMLVYLRANPLAGCACVYLTDCDGRGKAPYLRNETALVVTENCDLEADLISLGLLRKHLEARYPGSFDAAALVTTAITTALPLSAVRRAAGLASVSMKIGGQKRLEVADVPAGQLRNWIRADHAPPVDEVLEVVRSRLEWTAEQAAAVNTYMPSVPMTFRETCSGKDVLGFADFILRDEHGVMSANTAGYIAQGLEVHDLPNWEVGRRMRTWQDANAHRLLDDVA